MSFCPKVIFRSADADPRTSRCIICSSDGLFPLLCNHASRYVQRTSMQEPRPPNSLLASFMQVDARLPCMPVGMMEAGSSQ